MPTEEEFVSKYGRPPGDPGDVLCFRVPQQDVFVYFGLTDEVLPRIAEVLVSAEPNCGPASGVALPKVSFAALTTQEGIKVGDSETKVIETDGAPNRIGEMDAASRYYLWRSGTLGANSDQPGAVVDRVLYYDLTDEFFSAFYVREGNILAILLDANE